MFPGKSSRLMGEKGSALTVSSWTSLPVATPSRPICPAALSTATSPTECSKGSGPVATWERTSRRKGTRLRRIERYAELARVGVKAPQRDEGSGRALSGVRRRRGLGRVNHIGDGRAGRHVQHQLAQFALRGPDGNVMGAFNDTRRGHVELGNLRIEDRLLALDVAAARLPGDPGVVGGRQHQRGDGVAADQCRAGWKPPAARARPRRD